MNYQEYRDLNGDLSDGILWIDDDGMVIRSIPPFVGNRDWDAYQVWLGQGNSPLPPESVSG